ncbi:hypothetical protein RhiJN_25153 [Ceratobasidium sp. AG-Ba]|nr:hypothetical protein RhiJN_25153 [Ceratobasidium sp. AG-Ba]
MGAHRRAMPSLTSGFVRFVMAFALTTLAPAARWVAIAVGTKNAVGPDTGAIVVSAAPVPVTDVTARDAVRKDGTAAREENVVRPATDALKTFLEKFAAVPLGRYAFSKKLRQEYQSLKLSIQVEEAGATA